MLLEQNARSERHDFKRWPAAGAEMSRQGDKQLHAFYNVAKCEWLWVSRCPFEDIVCNSTDVRVPSYFMIFLIYLLVMFHVT